MLESTVILLSWVLLALASSLPFAANFGETPLPFKIDVRILLGVLILLKILRLTPILSPKPKSKRL